MDIFPIKKKRVNVDSKVSNIIFTLMATLLPCKSPPVLMIASAIAKFETLRDVGRGSKVLTEIKFRVDADWPTNAEI